ncbi:MULTISPECIES: SulP family inorganic anion transporter [unclassified Streptomyces]|uniref:SulP family inorganic anion transporter n=1 Tax=unclassified Streptomyces TaxID=2593676 RepID=UPI00081EF4D2|nr:MULTISPECIES: SulP family inorganic anion transporter [unclassified Streptomyces]MYZ38891.1 SulP family inorganic anion transporter [Streptomyces sp. SID4917]SCG00942.1 Sulfate permease, MFS superfamily [Streptomyces sp. MnatMP-M17]
MPQLKTVGHALRTDAPASLVVFLVALPLCVGVAVASGVPAELGLITGIVGGLLTGLLPGSSLQVSGPAAGLTVLVTEAVRSYGLPTLGVIVLATGLLQIALGAMRLGSWFRAISVAVVEGMLAGIGLVIIAAQLYTLADTPAPASGIGKITGLPALIGVVAASPAAASALALGGTAIAVCALWRWMPGTLRRVPGALAAVLITSLGAAVLDLPVATVEISGLLDAVNFPSVQGVGALTGLGVLATVLAFTLIASAESLFSAAAVDRLHDGPRTHFDKELMAQGAGNAVCGLLGALPMTAVIVRSAANVQAGAKTKASRVLHGVWLLLFAALFPAVLGLVPVAALAGVLIYAGFKLLPLRQMGPMWRAHRGEAIILLTTATAIVTVNMFEGVLIGLALSVVKTAWDISHIQIDVSHNDDTGPLMVRIAGYATFLRLPKLLDALGSLPADRPIHLDLTGLRHQDHACTMALLAWAEQHNTQEPQRVHVIAAS